MSFCFHFVLIYVKRDRIVRKYPSSLYTHYLEGVLFCTDKDQIVLTRL